MAYQQSISRPLWLSLGPALLAGAPLVLPAVMGVGVLLVGFFGYKTALARQGEMPVRVTQWYGQVGEQFSGWAMIMLGIALGTNLLSKFLQFFYIVTKI